MKREKDFLIEEFSDFEQSASYLRLIWFFRSSIIGIHPWKDLFLIEKRYIFLTFLFPIFCNRTP